MNKLLMLAFLVVLMGLVATAAPQEEGGKVDLEDAVESREAREAQRDFIPRKSKKQKATRKSKKQKATRKGLKKKSKKNKATRSGERKLRKPRESSKNVAKADLEDFVESREVREAQRDFIPTFNNNNNNIPKRNKERKGQKNKNKKATRKGQKNKSKKNN